MARSSNRADSGKEERVYCVKLDYDEKWQWGEFVDAPPLLFAPGDDDARTVPAYAMAASDWVPLDLSHYAEGRNARKQKIADFTRVLTGVYAVSARARRALESVCGDWVDWLPLKSALGEYYWMRANRVLDALDIEASICEFYEYSPTDVRRIDHHVFKPGAVGNAPMFFLKQHPTTQLYATQAFVDAYNDAGLTGLLLELVFPVPRQPVSEAPKSSMREPKPQLGPPLPSLKAEPLPPELRKDFRRMSKKFLRKHGDDLAKELKAELDDLRAAATDAEALEEAANDLGLRFGYLLARELNWRLQWGSYAAEGGTLEGPAVVSMDNKYAVFPAHMVYAKLTNKDEANTLLLLYNMLKAGQLPPPPAKGTKLIW